MYVNQTVTFENDHYTVVLNVPTLANIQPLIDYARPQIAKAVELEGKDDTIRALASIPDVEDLTAGSNAVIPFIQSFTDTEGHTIDTNCIGLSEASFLQAVAIQLYTDCIKQSALKKK